MEGILTIFVFLVFIIVITGILNEKVLKISNNIALLIVSFCISILLLIGNKLDLISNDFFVFTSLNRLHLDEILLEGVICFMIFAGASKIQFTKLVSNYKSISMLAILTTILSSMIYGVLFYTVSTVFKIGLDLATCFLLGSIISPTDPIAASSILNKLGLPKGISSVIEGESLFNDGIGVALFAFIQNIITNAKSQNFLWLVTKNISGALVIGLFSSFILFKLTKKTKEPNLHILISLMNVSFCYVICEHFGFSGVIASVVCGIYFSYQNKKCERWKKVVDSNNLYIDFWNTIDELLNSVLFVLIGLTAFIIPINYKIIWIIPTAIIVNFISRYVSVFISGVILGDDNIPNKYSIKDFTKLMTYTAMRGGVSLALAFSTNAFLNEKEYNIILNATLITILFTTIVQGMLIPVVYKGIEEKRNTKALMKT
ncbi:MAG: sodium:proton antiporter [Clostridia bacterium]|nr:sodium:proton antiporter [Clostridia bacterium]